MPLPFFQNVLIVPKLLYVTIFMAICSLYPFIPLFLEDNLGLTPDRIGIFLGCSPFVEFFSSAAWSSLADRYLLHKRILTFCTAGGALFMLALPILGPSVGFPVLLGSFLVCACLMGAVMPLVDAYVLGVLERIGNKAVYGQQRLFGTISCGLTGAIVGALIDTFHGVEISFFVYGVFISLFLILVSLIPASEFSPAHFSATKPSDQEQADFVIFQTPILLDTDNSDELSFTVAESGDESDVLVQPRSTTTHNMSTPRFATALFTLLTRPSFILFLLVTFLMGFGRAAASSFLFMYLESLGASRTLMGLTQLSGVLLEIFCFRISDHLLRTIGYRRMIFASQIALVIRASIYGWIGQALPPVASLVVEMLQGLTYALFWSGGAHFVTEVAPLDLQAATIGVYTGFYMGIGGGLGGIVGGAIYSAWGAPVLYQCIALLAAVSLFLYSGEDALTRCGWGWRYGRIVDEAEAR
ncbi:hypothetical protein BC937DRAFT_92403 [Endogone sp. FLAS-F59071]|nr:hypothetical protein BC937DRAFT_92403 [Endogone sp. FLAS-F59071]|eukprot:RUS21527.1 hypothetical protein BC937DRAFT_92403 [Endogone sp. FLAS-F59071]